MWPDQPESQACADILNDLDDLATSPFVLAEVDYLITQRVGTTASIRALGELLESGLGLAHISWGDVQSARAIMSQYEDLNIGLTDSSLVVLAKRYKTNEILTLDQRHFRAIRGLDGRHFRILPYDAD